MSFPLPVEAANVSEEERVDIELLVACMALEPWESNDDEEDRRDYENIFKGMFFSHKLRIYFNYFKEWLKDNMDYPEFEGGYSMGQFEENYDKLVKICKCYN